MFGVNKKVKKKNNLCGQEKANDDLKKTGG